MTNEERYKSIIDLINSRVEQLKDAGTPPSVTWSSDFSTKHRGQFSPSNPYYKQLWLANSKADEDAIFELAVKWESEQAGYQQERADKFADLQEQRAYDDPTAVVARQRRAGINTDLAGAGVGAGVGTGSSATADMPSLETPTENTSKFSNHYDSMSMLINGFGVAASMVSSISGFASTVINGITSLAMLPIQKDAGELANNLSREVNPIVADTANENLRSIRIANDSSELGVINDTLNTLSSLSNFIPPETSDEDASTIMQSLGIPADRIPALNQGRKQWHTNPAYKATFEENKRRALANEEYNSVYTSEVLHGMLSVGQQIEALEQNLTFATEDLKLRVANLLNTDAYANAVATETMVSTQLGTKQSVYDSKQLDLLRQQLDRDFVAFEEQLNFLVTAEDQSKKFIQEIRQKAFRENRSLSASEKALVDVEYQKIHAIHSLGARYLSDAQTFVTNTVQNRLYFRGNINQGSLTPDWTNITRNNLINTRLNFRSLTTGEMSSSDATSALKDGLIEGLKIVF